MAVMTYVFLLRVFSTDWSKGPLCAIKNFMPHLLRAGGGKIINISSNFGSIQGRLKAFLLVFDRIADEKLENGDERFIGYKMAKAALNQPTKTLDNDFRKNQQPISIISLEPGYIKTRLSLFRGNVDIEESVTAMMNITENLEPEHSGLFLNWEKRELKW